MTRQATASKKHYPIALSLQGKRCLVAGFGSVGQRKLARLLDLGEAGPEAIFVFDPYLPKDPPSALLRSAKVHCKRQSVTRADLNVQLVFACTGSQEENVRIAKLCAELGVLCNCASSPECGDVHLPALIQCPPLTLTLSTEGASPALAKKWRRELETWAQKKQPILQLMAVLRPKILAQALPQTANRKLFTTLAQGPLEEWLACGQREKAHAYLTALLPKTLHQDLEIALNDLFAEEDLKKTRERP